MRVLLGPLAAIGMVLALPAHAAPADFIACDGYGPPKGGADGIVKALNWLGLGTSTADLRQGAGWSAGAQGVSSCDSALADPLLRPEFTVRKVSLLQAKALHQVADQKPDEAIRTLDQAAALPVNSAQSLREQGLGIANRAIRTLALIALGKGEEAKQQVDAIEKQRPYANSVLALADILRLKLDPGLDAHLALLRTRAPLSPAAAMDGFFDAVRQQRFADVTALGLGLTFELPALKGDWTIQGAGTFNYDIIDLRAELAGALAYAFAATGNRERSDYQIQTGRYDIQLASQPPPPSPTGRPPSKQQATDYELRQSAARVANLTLDRWVGLMALRNKAKALTIETLEPELQSFPKGTVYVVADLIAQLAVRSDSERQARDDFLRDMIKQFDAARITSESSDLKQFMAMLPRPETPDNQAQFRKTGNGIIRSGDIGFSNMKMAMDDRWTVRFADYLASQARIDELSVLAAAVLTKDKSFNHFIIETRRGIQRTTKNYSWYGGLVNETNSGRESQMTIRMVRPGNLPRDLQGAEWRILDADKIIGDFQAADPTLAVK